jgi:type VI secretion system protein ImpF
MADTGSLRKSGTYLPGVFLRLTSGERLQDLSDLKHLKQEILDNISLIFNSCSRPGPDELGNDPYIIYSVLGFGIGNFCGRQSSEETVNGICRQIREQIIHFEPRLDPKSVLVEAKKQ